MKMSRSKWKVLCLFGAVAALGACKDDDATPAGKGEAQFEITDAPVDDANVKGVFVTVADVKVNGNSLQGFSKQTIDLKAYSEGKTKVLGAGEFDARTYENVVLVLDLEADQNDASPGCYVLDQNNAKHQLKTTASGTTEIVVSKSWSVAKDAKTDIILDFDLRKAIRYTEGAPEEYSFVSDNGLSAAVSLAAKAKTGTIKGSYQESGDANADRIIVYAYGKGTFDEATETAPRGEDGLLFTNARSSAVVKQSLTGNEFTLAFLEEGEYELHFIGYSHDATTGRYHFEAQLDAETTVDGSVADIVTVQGGATITVASTITGLL